MFDDLNTMLRQAGQDPWYPPSDEWLHEHKFCREKPKADAPLNIWISFTLNVSWAAWRRRGEDQRVPSFVEWLPGFLSQVWLVPRQQMKWLEAVDELLHAIEPHACNGQRMFVAVDADLMASLPPRAHS